MHPNTSLPRTTAALLTVAAVALPVASAADLLLQPPAEASPITPTAYIVNANDSSVTPIGIATNTAGTAITGGGLTGPVRIAITPNGQTAYVTNAGGNSVTPINLATNTAGTGDHRSRVG